MSSAFFSRFSPQEGPDQLSALEDDAQLGEEQAAWTPVLSSTSEAVKNQVGAKRAEVEVEAELRRRCTRKERQGLIGVWGNFVVNAHNCLDGDAVLWVCEMVSARVRRSARLSPQSQPASPKTSPKTSNLYTCCLSPRGVR